MRSVAKWFWVVVAAQALFLVGWAGYHEVVRRHAPVILLQAYPADPRDLLRGDYMMLRYDISTAGVAADAPKTGEPVWVLLGRNGRHYEIVQVSRARLAPAPGQVLVAARVGFNRWGIARGMTVDYGIERYFVPEGKGTPPHFGRMEVEASVSPAHRLYIRRLLLDGKAYP